VALEDALTEEQRSRRFGGVARLWGEAGADRIARAHVVVVGVGGVGSWAAEALARCGVGQLTLIDLDHVAESNINRQVHALESTLGAAKVQVMAQRIQEISPGTRVCPIEEFVTPDTVEQWVPQAACAVIDAIDAPRAKAALIATCMQRGQPIQVCGAAGGRTDPLSLVRTDLAFTRADALLASVRARLRREHDFSREPGRAFGVQAVWSAAPASAARPTQTLRRQTTDGASAPDAVPAVAGAPLACSGYGSVVMMTAAMGFAAASGAIDAVLGA
jgi:tRNA A37 threonylcarbamoyladenosine dehydratase